MKSIYLHLGLGLFFTSCVKDQPQYNVDTGTNYYPTKIGTFVEYDVTEIYHDGPVNIHDTSVYQLKEIIESEFIDNSGQTTYRIERYKRDSSHHSWQISDVWFANKSNSRLEKVEENQRFIKLIFPTREGESWDGNAANNMNPWDYEITGIDEVKTHGLLNYDSCLTVNQRNFTPGIYFIERAEEVFAKNIGLVSKYYKVVTINGIDTADVTGGNELYMTSYLYGIE